MKKLVVIMLLGLIALLTACDFPVHQGNIQKAGMLMEGSINDQAWGKKGYKGLRAIADQYDVEVYYEEGIKSEEDVKHVVEEFVNKGVNLIFGHGTTYGKTFVEMAPKYPEVQFVYFNGGYYAGNVASLNFNAQAMGFFAGMVAGEMSRTNQIGMMAKYEWQSEVEGFYEGVNYQNSDAEVHIDFVNDWNDEQDAMSSYWKMLRSDVDVVYPTGDTFSEDVIQRASKDGIYALGYIADRSDIDERTVLTSTVQHADQLYEQIAAKFNKGKITGSILTFDFQDDAISLGEFSPDVPKTFQEKMKDAVAVYKKTGSLPYERDP